MNLKKKIHNLSFKNSAKRGVFFGSTLIGAVLLLGACASSPTRSVSNTTDSRENLEVQFWDGRKKLVQERDLFQAFNQERDQFEVFQLVCESGGAQTQCSYRTQPQSFPKGSKAVKLSPANSAKLFDLLVNLPIAKGDSGVSVDYLICRRYRQGNKESYQHSCSIAAPVGLIPHTSAPVTDLADELPDTGK